MMDTTVDAAKEDRLEVIRGILEEFHDHVTFIHEMLGAGCFKKLTRNDDGTWFAYTEDIEEEEPLLIRKIDPNVIMDCRTVVRILDDGDRDFLKAHLIGLYGEIPEIEAMFSQTLH